MGKAVSFCGNLQYWVRQWKLILPNVPYVPEQNIILSSCNIESKFYSHRQLAKIGKSKSFCLKKVLKSIIRKSSYLQDGKSLEKMGKMGWGLMGRMYLRINNSKHLRFLALASKVIKKKNSSLVLLGFFRKRKLSPKSCGWDIYAAL